MEKSLKKKVFQFSKKKESACVWLALCSHTHSSCCGYQKAVEAVPWSWPGCLNAINTILLRWYVVCAEKEKRTKKLACASWRVLVSAKLTDTLVVCARHCSSACVADVD